MSTWMIIGWVLVVLLTAINVFVFIKLKGASEQMLKMAFPGAKNMGEALSQMQSMMGRMPGRRGAGAPTGGAGGGSDAQLKAALEMLQQMKKNKR